MRKLMMIALLFLICMLISCNTYDEKYSELFSFYYRNSLPLAIQSTDATLQSMSPDDDDLPLVLLERASMAMAAGDYSTASSCLQQADNITEVIDLTQDPREVGKYLFTDSAGVYRIQPHEQIQMNTMGMIAALANGDLQSAGVELRRAKSQEEYWVNREDQLDAKNPLVQLLGASISWHSGKRTEADFFKRQLKELVGPATSEELLGKFPQEGEKELLVIILNGQSPVKREVRQHVHSEIARIVTHTGFTGDTLIYPCLVPRYAPFQNAQMVVDGKTRTDCFKLLDIEGQAIRWFEKNKTKIMIAAASRMAVRAAASTAVAEGVYEGSKSHKKNQSEEEKAREEHERRSWAMLAGSLTNLFMQAGDRADTRCWTILPKNILVGRIVGKLPGQVNLQVKLGGGASRTISQTVSLNRSLTTVVLVAPTDNICYPPNMPLP